MQTNSLTQVIKQTFKWYKKLTKRFIDLAFPQTVIVILTTLFSQFFMLISSVMPLKVIMLLGSESVPKYLPYSWQLLGRDTLIVYFALSALLFYLLHLLSERIMGIYALKGSNIILKNNQKVVLFEKQDIFAQNAYTKQSKSLANIIFFILVLAILFFVYPVLVCVIIFFILIVYSVFDKMYSTNNFRDSFNEGFNDLLNLIRGIGFFIVFAFILLSYILGFHAPHIMVAILSVLLIRQMFSKLGEAIKSIRYLYINRIKINSLFLFSHVNKAIDHERRDFFWNMLEVQNRKVWIEELLGSVFDASVTYVDSQWFKIDIKNVACLKIFTKSKKQQVLLLKLYNHNISSQAIHEATLLQKYDIGLKLLSSGTVEGLCYNLFEGLDFNQTDIEEYAYNYYAIRLKLMSIPPPNELVKRYERSHQYLHQNINKNMFHKLYIVCSDCEVEMIKKFEKKSDKIVSIIQTLPLQIINPTVSKYSLIRVHREMSLLHWGSWKIDSIGVDYPINLRSLNILEQEYKKIKNLKEIKIEHIILTAFVSQFYKFYTSENFGLAIELIPDILKLEE